MRPEPQILFLPGVTGDGAFWRPVGKRLPISWRKRYFNWPGLGNQPASPSVNGFTDLFYLVDQALTRPSIVVAQSMAGIIAVQLALKHPVLVTHLVLVATSGGLDVAAFGASDWREDFLAAFPDTPSWLFDTKPDLADMFAHLAVPTLLVWGDDDAISPVAVGRHLASVITRSELVIIPGGRHSMAVDRPASVAPLIEEYVSKPGPDAV